MTSTLQVLRLVTARELRVRGRSKPYLLSGAFVLILITAVALLPALLADSTVSYRIGVIGAQTSPVVEVARTLAAQQLDEDDTLDFGITTFDDEEEARASLAEGGVELVLLDDETILRQGAAGFSGGSGAEQLLQQAAAITDIEDRLQGSTVTAADVAAELDATPLQVRTVRDVGGAEAETSRNLIAYGGMFLLYMAILSYGQWTLMGIAEEKSSRVVEVLLATVKPWQLLTGKILGIGALGLAQFGLTVVWGLTLITLTDVVAVPVVPVDSALTLMLWFVLGFGLYSVVYATAGSLVSRMEDAQSVAFPVSMIAIVGFLVSFQVLDDPSGTTARVTTFLPFMAPFVVPVRVAYQEISAVEHLAAVVVTVATIAVLVRVAGRLYAGSLLQFGGRVRLRQAWRNATGSGSR